MEIKVKCPYCRFERSVTINKEGSCSRITHCSGGDDFGRKESPGGCDSDYVYKTNTVVEVKVKEL